jgi:Na+-transporting NADH:ubiquinone oxidoreductase subunit B
MNMIRKLFDSNRRHFEENGRLIRLKPLFDATESFFFLPSHIPVTGPHVRDSLDIKRFMVFVILAICPTLLWGIFNVGYHSLLLSGRETGVFNSIVQGVRIVMPIVVVSYVVGFLWEVIFAVFLKREISEGFFVTGILFPLTLPPTIPLWQVALGISFGVIIGKEVFGGTGRNFLNPALVGRAFLFFAYPVQMSGDAVWTASTVGLSETVDMVSGATPLSISNICTSGENVVLALEKSGFSFLKLFVGLYPGSIGETSSLLCLLGAVFLIATGIASYRIIIGGILGVLIAGFFLNFFAAPTSLAWFSLNPFYHLVMGGFAFGVVFMATDPVSAPGVFPAQWLYGFAIGLLTILIRVFNPAYVEGIMLSILFMNMFSPLFDHFFIRWRIKKRIPNV